MARPKPTLLLSRVDKNFRCEEVLKLNDVYAVYYNNDPINIRTYHKLIPSKALKYKNCNFTSAAAAFNLASRLNFFFNTNQFKVHKMIIGPEITCEEEAKKMIKKR